MSGIVGDNVGRASGLIKAASGGTVVQQTRTIFDAIYTLGPTTFTEANTGNRVTITPTSTSNFLMLECYIPVQFGGGGALRAYRWYDVTGSAQFAPSTVTTGSLDKGHTSFRGATSDVNDCDFIYVRTIGACPRTTSSVFTPQIRSQSGTYYVNYGTNSSHVNAVSVMTATEIAVA